MAINGHQWPFRFVFWYRRDSVHSAGHFDVAYIRNEWRRKSKENHKKSIGTLENVRQLLNHSCNAFMEITCSKAPQNYSVSIWYFNFSICLWERQHPLISMISGFLNVSLAPNNQLCLSLEIPGDLKESKKHPQLFYLYFVVASQAFGNTCVEHSGKMGTAKSRRYI